MLKIMSVCPNSILGTLTVEMPLRSMVNPSANLFHSCSE
jgi:hypothetical protein